MRSRTLGPDKSRLLVRDVPSSPDDAVAPGRGGHAANGLALGRRTGKRRYYQRATGGM